VSVLGARDAAAVRDVLSALERDVEVTLELGPSATPVTLVAAGGRDIDTGEETRRVVEAVCAESERVTLTVVEHDDPGPWPRTTIGPGLEYLGMPLGYELTSLVHGILESGRAESSLTEASRERLAGLERDVMIDVYVTPT
jgi:alkyl hydroperoxide reductase subunit AhpF